MSGEQGKSTCNVDEEHPVSNKEKKGEKSTSTIAKNRSKKKAVKNKNRKTTIGHDPDVHYISYIADAIFAFVLIAFSLCDGFLIKKHCPNYSSIPNYSFAVVVTLMPCIVTIVSLLLSIGKDEIYGATIAEINKMRGPGYFTLFHNVLVSCFVIIAHAILVFFDLRGTLWVLEALASIYAVTFVLQQLPVMVRSEKTVRRILRRKFLTENPENLLFSRTSSDTFEKMITEIVFGEGMGTAYRVLIGNNATENLVYYLFNTPNEYFWNALDDVSDDDPMLGRDEETEVLIKRIGQAYGMICDMLSYDSRGVLSDQLTADKYFHFTRTLFVLHKLCSKLGLKEKEKSAINRIFSNTVFHPFSKPDASLKTAVITCMIVTTLNEGETWFLEYFRDSDYGLSPAFNLRDNLMGVFTSMIIHHLLSKKALTEDEKKKIDTFMKEPAKGVNSDGFSWLETMHQSLQYFDVEDAIESITGFLNIFDSVSDGVFYLHGNRKRPSYDGSEIFTKRDLFHDWLLLVFSTSNWADFSTNPFEKDKLFVTEQNKKEFVEELSEKWLLNKQLRKDVDCSFLKFYGGDDNDETSANWAKEPLAEKLCEFHDSFYDKQNEKNRFQTSDKEFDNAKKIIANSFADAVHKNKFFAVDLNVDNEPMLYFECELRGRDWMRQLTICLSRLPTYFMLRTDEIIEANASTINISEDESPKQLLRKVSEIHANRTSCLYWRKNYLSAGDSELKKKIEDLHIEYISGIHPLLFWKDGGIRFNAKIDADHTKVRRLTAMEIDEIIKEEYPPFENGLYRYSQIKGDDKHSFSVTKERLSELIKETTFRARIAFRFMADVDSKSVILLNHKIDRDKYLKDPSKPSK